ncbi:MAG: hypothetical protein IJ775_07470 [Muribaculaceae bacterium]|nr:hypothetical protein [Muribaculaceae bacterium]
MRHLLIIIVALILTGCSCGRNEDKTAQVATDSTMSISAHDAEQLAIAAAGAIALSDSTDTLAIQRAIVDAYATRSKMVLEGNEQAAEAFDQALQKELQRLNAALANEIFPDNQQ